MLTLTQAVGHPLKSISKNLCTLSDEKTSENYGCPGGLGRKWHLEGCNLIMPNYVTVTFFLL